MQTLLNTYQGPSAYYAAECDEYDEDLPKTLATYVFLSIPLQACTCFLWLPPDRYIPPLSILHQFPANMYIATYELVTFWQKYAIHISRFDLHVIYEVRTRTSPSSALTMVSSRSSQVIAFSAILLAQSSISAIQIFRESFVGRLIQKQTFDPIKTIPDVG